MQAQTQAQSPNLSTTAHHEKSLDARTSTSMKINKNFPFSCAFLNICFHLAYKPYACICAWVVNENQA